MIRSALLPRPTMLLSILPHQVNLRDYRVLRSHALRHTPPQVVPSHQGHPGDGRRRLHLTYHYRSAIAQAELIEAL